MKKRLFSWFIAVTVTLVAADRFTLGNGQSPGESGRQKSSEARILKLFVEECVDITPGNGAFPKSFQMGGPIQVPLAAELREVQMTSAFRISRYEVTQELYRVVMGVNPSRWKGERNSVEMVSFQDAQQFCARLTALLRSEKLLTDKQAVRLPTEAEWEYCCRAGTNTAFSFGDSATAEGDQENIASILNDYAWHTGNAAGNDPVVGALKPNPWGLYDVHGYLWEFVSDPYNKTGSAANESTGEAKKESPASRAARIIRGGSWRDHHSLLTSYSRLVIPDHAASDAIGFRCVIESSP
ncbi:MAG: formylglycine-generating enzyme family protein [Planctomycetaceae bacterium]